MRVIFLCRSGGFCWRAGLTRPEGAAAWRGAPHSHSRWSGAIMMSSRCWSSILLICSRLRALCGFTKMKRYFFRMR